MKSTSKRLFNYIKKQKNKILWGVLATLLMSLVELATGGLLKYLTNLMGKIQGNFTDQGAELIKLPLRYNIKFPFFNYKLNIIDTTLKGADGIFMGLVALCGVFLLLYFLKTVFNYLRRVFMNAATQRILQNFKVDIYNKILKLPFSFFNTNKTGDVVSRITYDVATLNEIIDLFIEVARAFIYVLVFIPVMFYMSWQLSLFTILFFPLSVILIEYITRKIKRVSKKITDNVGDYTAFLEERITRFKIVKSFGKEGKESAAFSKLVEENYQHNLKLIKLRYSMNPTNDFLGMMLLAVVYLFYSYKITHSATSLGDIVLFLYLVKTAFKPIKKVAEAWGQLQVALVSTRKIFLLLDESEEGENKNLDAHTQIIDTIHLREISFSYAKNYNKIFENVSFTVKRGDVIAINGKTGSGKTTLLNLLPSYLLPDSGQLQINNKPYSDFSLSYIRSQIKLVEAGVPFFDATVHENLVYSGESITQSQMETYSHFLGLSSGRDLNQVIGKDGINLSLGQQQKLGFLRALISKPQVLILDEVFSSLDLEDIHYIFEACKSIPILFIVSRKSEVLKYANRQFTFEQGHLSELQ